MKPKADCTFRAGKKEERKYVCVCVDGGGGERGGEERRKSGLSKA